MSDATRHDGPLGRSRIALLGGWVTACAGGVGLAALSMTAAPFVSWLFLYGGLIGLAQAPVVVRALRVGLGAMGRWTAGSFGGWVAGALLSAGFTAGPAFLALPWLGFSAGQLPLLTRALSHHGARTRGIAILWWMLASTVGGGLAAHLTTWAGTTASYQNVELHLGGIGAGVIRQMLVIAVVYGLASGSVLLWITHRAQERS